MMFCFWFIRLTSLPFKWSHDHSCDKKTLALVGLRTNSNFLIERQLQNFGFHTSSRMTLFFLLPDVSKTFLTTEICCNYNTKTSSFTDDSNQDFLQIKYAVFPFLCTDVAVCFNWIHLNDAELHFEILDMLLLIFQSNINGSLWAFVAHTFMISKIIISHLLLLARRRQNWLSWISEFLDIGSEFRSECLGISLDWS